MISASFLFEGVAAERARVMHTINSFQRGLRTVQSVRTKLPRALELERFFVPGEALNIYMIQVSSLIWHFG